jgi:flagellin-like hook-associated protein FlgL
VLELTKQQELTKQAEAREREADFRRQASALDKVQTRIDLQSMFSKAVSQAQAQVYKFF